ncbi:MAG: polyprenyl synthetase family protein [Candidatus Marinimicrobia bacterium]|nr:polyprenyl synthetase family protein [Candidatus Neomarinimicrobiota bacterium]
MQDNHLENILSSIQVEMTRFENKYARILESDVKLINRIGKYISDTKGKRLRPAILILCAKNFGDINPRVIDAATVVELLHTATLIHDDVVDKAERRRGEKSINNIWQNKIAVLMGDYLFSRSLSKLINLKNHNIMKDISQTTEHLSSGELLQIEKSQDNGMTEAVYNEMIFYKTASLFATSCQLGAKLMNASHKEYQAFYNFGNYLGRAFQIKDDLFDISGKTENTGKPIGLDVKQNILTLPIIYTLDKLDGQEHGELKNLLDQRSNIQIEELAKYVKKAGGFAYCRKRIDEYVEKAKAALTIFKKNKIIDSLVALAEYNKYRKR